MTLLKARNHFWLVDYFRTMVMEINKNLTKFRIMSQKGLTVDQFAIHFVLIDISTRELALNVNACSGYVITRTFVQTVALS